MSPWLDLRVPPNEVKLAALEAQRHRRFIKTHLPLDALVYSPRAKYIYIARDGRDVVWSMYNHHVNANALWYKLLNDTPGRVGPPIEKPPASIRQYFLDWMDRDGHPFWPFWENIAGWWAARDLPNLMLLHFEELRADLPRQMRRIAAYLDISIDEGTLPDDGRALQFYVDEGQRDEKHPPRWRDMGRRCRGFYQQGHQWPLARRAAPRGCQPVRSDCAGKTR